MGVTVHPQAVVEAGAQLADGVTVGPFCVVGSQVRIGPGTRLISHVSVVGRTTLGSGNLIAPFASLGSPPQDKKYHGEPTELIIGDDNVIRESVTMNTGTSGGGAVTRMGDRNLLMAYAHVAHDCLLGNDNIIANSVNLAGHIHIGDFVNLSGMSGFHHFTTIGDHAFVGGASRVTLDVPPYMMMVGSPARVYGVNKLGLRRAGFPEDEIQALIRAHRKIFRTTTPRAKVLDEFERNGAFHSESVRNLVGFLRRQCEGVNGRYLEGLRRKTESAHS